MIQQVRAAALTQESAGCEKGALAASKEALLPATESTDVVVYLKDAEGRYVLMSPWYESQFHHEQRFEGRTDYDIFPEKYADELRKHDELAIKAGRIMEFREVIPHEDGIAKSISFKFPIFDHEGNVCGLCGFATPLTTDRHLAMKTRKKSEDFYSVIFNTIRESEVRYRTLFESANDAVFLVKDDILIDCNKRALEMFGCKKHQVTGKTLLQFFPKKQPGGASSRAAATKKISLATKGIEQRFEWMHCRRDGTEFESEVSLNRIELSGQIYIQAIVRDVTDRKQAERKKQEMLETLRAFMDNSPAVIFIKDKESKYIDVNRRFEEMFGVFRDNIIGKSDYDIFPKEQSDKFRAEDLRVLSGEVLEYELVLKLDTGRTETFIDHKFALKDEKGYPYAICGVATNITERKEAEQSIKESEERYRTLANHVADGVMLVQHGKLVFVNDALVRMFGFKNQEELQSQPAVELVSPGEQDYFLRMCDSLAGRLGIKEVFQAQCVTKGGKKFWTEGDYSVIAWKGQPAILGTLKDITEFKLREQAMQEETEQVRNELIRLKSSLKDRYRLGNIIGKSAAMQKVYEQILKAAGCDANVVIMGESGTGKELVARAIHEMSGRGSKPFIPVNCGAIPENLVESEFFGYRRGAFTGADAEKRGYLYSARGGTLFLDEVGEIGLAMQVKLLRAIESGEYTLLGDTLVQKANVRVIAATSKNLRDMVRRGLMREDFYFRVSIISIVVPPLRNRGDDIPLLASHFFKVYGNEKSVDVPGEIMEAIYKYRWPGNVRELQNVIQRYLAVGSLDFEEAGAFPKEKNVGEKMSHEITSLREALADFEKQYILRALQENRWAKGKTAAVLEVDPKTLYRKMKMIGLV